MKTASHMKMFGINDCIPFWSELSEANKALIKDNVVTRSYNSSKRVMINMAKKDGIIFVVSGCLRVYVASDSGREVTLFKLNQGDAFSIMTVDDAKETDVVPSIVAVEKSSVAYLSEEVLAQIAFDDPKMAVFVYRCAARNAQLILNNTAYLFFNTLKGCTARYIIDASEKTDPPMEIVHTTHEEIANHLGSTRVVISRELDNMRDLGLIQTKRGCIKILDRAGLESIAGR